MAPPHEQPSRHIPVIGLLGAPGSGKSSIARMFAQRGCVVIDADQLAREALDDDAVRDTLVSWWGEEAAPEGVVDRRAVGRIVFADAGQRRRLEGVVHPYVNRRRGELRRAVLEREREAAPAIIEDCPLLLEAGLADGCDVLVFVDCPLAERRRRVEASRGWSAEELASRERAQLPLDTKRAAADYTIENVGEKTAIQSRIDSVLADIRRASP